MGTTQKDFSAKYEEYMKNFLCRLLRLDFVVSYINEFFNKNERTYYSYFMLMKVLGAHTNRKFQTNYWSDCYIYFYEKLGIHGILFIPLLLSKGSTDDKKKILKKYLNEHINNTKERITANSNLVMNLLEFKKVILTYISCVTTRGLENVIKAIDNEPKDPKESEDLQDKEKKDIKEYRILYSNQLVESFVDVLLRPYSRQNYYVNASKFIDDNIDFLTDDKIIRIRLRNFSLGQKDISNRLNKELKKEKDNNQSDILSNIRENEKKNENGDISKILSNNNITNNENIKSSRNKLISDEMEPTTLRDRKGIPLIGESEHLNEPFKTIESARRGMLDTPKGDIIQETLKNNNENNDINFSLQSGDMVFRKENSIKPIEIKSGTSSKNPVISESKNNTFSEFMESFREENIPKQI